jgi:tellurite resistance protein tehB
MTTTTPQDFWNSRYQADDYVYGKAPNAFFRSQLDRLTVGNILLPAEGEGRNAVYAATQGWQVTAFDMSREGKRKADALAAERGVSLHYRVGTLDELDFPREAFDTLALVFAHFPAGQRHTLHRALLGLLKPGGTVILEGFSKNPLPLSRKNPALGGPGDEAMLFSLDEIRTDFTGCDILLLEETLTELREGQFHNGQSSVIRFVGRKAG